MSKEVAAEPGLSYEAVLEAVQESSRGRWFLNEFKSRNGGTDAGPILSAIARLESRMESLSPGGGDAAAELARVRQAIATTRQDILKASGAPGLSDEGRLFAHLAELARKSLAQAGAAGGTAPGSEALPGSIVQALRLVEQLDSGLNGGQVAARASTEGYFHRDKDLFQPQDPGGTPAVKPAAKPDAKSAVEAPPSPAPAQTREKPVVDAPALGAKLTVSRHKPADPPKQEAALPMAVAPPAPPAITGAEGHGHPRIVIIRRKPGETMQSPAAADHIPAEHAA